MGTFLENYDFLRVFRSFCLSVVINFEPKILFLKTPGTYCWNSLEKFFIVLKISGHLLFPGRVLRWWADAKFCKKNSLSAYIQRFCTLQNFNRSWGITVFPERVRGPNTKKKFSSDPLCLWIHYSVKFPLQGS